MQRIDVVAEVRVTSGKGPARQLRRDGRIPAVLYSAGASTPLTLDPRQIVRVIQHGGHGQNVLIQLALANNQDRPGCTAILRDFQLDPLTGHLLHADLFEIALDQPIRLKVPVERIGDQPAGVKEGGVLQYELREIEVEGLPDAIPDRFRVDASHLAIGQALHVKDLAMPPGVKAVSGLHLQVLSVVAPISEAKLEQLLTATPAAEAKEPEVLRERKKPEEGGVEEKKTGAKADDKGAKAEGKADDKGAKAEGKGKKDGSKREEKKKPSA